MRGFEELFRTEYARLVRCLRSVDDNADDVVQESFARAYVRWRWVKELDDPAGWVRRDAVTRLRAHRLRELTALALFYGGEYSITEIAYAMNISDAQVFERLRRGRERVRTQLAVTADV